MTSLLSQVIDDHDMQRILSEFSRLGERCYLENAGSSLYPQCLLTSINQDLMKNCYMNPHTDRYTKDCIEQIRYLILNHFNTDSSKYTVIFTSGCTQSLKIVGESFQFASVENEIPHNGTFIYLQDNHTSVVGLREYAIQNNAEIVHIPHNDFLNTIKDKQGTPWRDKYKKGGNALLAYPAQSNFNGYKYPLDCIQDIKNGCLNSYVKKNLCDINSSWYILLDVATFISTSKLDLSKYQPDFITLSFYKLFGMPTGLGALIVKNSSGHILNQKKYFGGGTVDVVLSSEDFHVKRKDLHERFEDGTVSFLSILALKHCFDTMHSLIPKVINNDVMDTVCFHTFCLARDMYQQLNELQHYNGQKAVILYMDTDFSDIKKQGALVTFNLLRDDGSYIGYAEFQHMAELFNINVRTGCFCNSGSCQRHLGVTNSEMKEIYKAGHKCGDDIDLVKGKPTGAIRVSFGYFNTFCDVDKFMTMITRCFVRTKLKKPNRQLLFKIPNYYKIMKNQSKEHIAPKLIYEEQNYIANIPPSHTDVTNSKIIVKEMAIFPIKSCGAFKVKSAWKIGPKGFEYDREWMIVTDNGVCLTQKQNSKMCTIQPIVDLKNDVLVLQCKGKSPITVPLLMPFHSKKINGQICQSKVCTDLVNGIDCGDDVANWISEALETSFLRLIRQSNVDGRILKKKKDSDTKQLSLSNQAQYLLINKATVRWLRDQIHDPTFTDDVPKLIDRFRGNIIIEMTTELVEREWTRVIIGNHEFKVEGQCARCQMVCIDQETGEKTVEPLRTIGEKFAGKLRFGIYLTYVGNVNDSQDKLLKTNMAVTPIISDDDISR